MYLQKALTKGIRADAVMEWVQVVSGVLLVLFLWTHAVFTSSILLGVGSFSALTWFMTNYHIDPIAVVIIIFLFSAHMGAVLRHLPGRWSEQKVVWKHAKMIHHRDTWSWLFQIVTGISIAIMAAIHIGAVEWLGISAKLTQGREDTPGFLILYLLLLVFSQYHAYVGLYRIFAKWGYVNRHSIDRVLIVITLIFVALGISSLVTFHLIKIA